MEKKKRDLIEEIILIKSRAEYNSRHELIFRLPRIGNALENAIFHEESSIEFLKYIPISTVACFEAFFRSVIKEIVDFGKPFSENVAKYNQSKNIKLDFEIVAAIQTKILTVGDFIAHILPFNNLEDINSNISTIIQKDFLEEIKKYSEGEISGVIIESIKSTFELRHIFCHEFATNTKLDTEKILDNLNNCIIFLEGANSFIWHLLHPNAPLTQTDQNIKASEDFKNVNKELNILLDLIKTLNGTEDFDGHTFDQRLFDEAIVKWTEYRDLRAECKASSVLGGSLYPYMFSTSLMDTTKEKIKSLEEEFEFILKKYRSKNK
ncbi:hypothetical protein MYP_3290 [Sporocytophaga myxococcoides]|uniref:Lysozyme inhibitor LprI-like N-terminal domain-containing protein n=1 Tax=Sporocytophaga myxococcoides TaxID=153721 RepID=A0A098LGF0_9BACT|nr:lysozyme inhibitor LprI family protein [Sporocytophaga myxococcoides]GAL86061.1 hypothetical protein MYP_3290 [Sporocytophaga myxococcoides]